MSNLIIILLVTCAASLKAGSTLDTFYHRFHQNAKIDRVSHLVETTDPFLGVAYLFSPLSDDGSNDITEKAFDCVTFVDTSLSLFYAQKVDDFCDFWQERRYQSGMKSMLNRNHIYELNWLPKAWFLEPIFESEGFHVSQVIDEGRFYQKLCERRGINDCHNYSHRPAQTVHMIVQSRDSLLKLPVEQWPDIGMIVNIKTDYPKDTSGLGTKILVAHMGLIYKKHGQINLRHSSMEKGQVVDVKLMDYIREHPSIHSYKVYRLR